MKKILAVVMVCLVMAAAVGCGQEEANVPVSTIVAGIKEEIGKDLKAGGVPEDQFKDGQLPGYMEVDLVKEKLSQYPQLEFNKEDIEEGILLSPMINIRADQIIILKAQDKDKVDVLKQALEKLKEGQLKIWESYLPDQYEKVNNNIIKTQGRYLIYITYDNPEAIEKVFDSALNK